MISYLSLKSKNVVTFLCVHKPCFLMPGRRFFAYLGGLDQHMYVQYMYYYSSVCACVIVHRVGQYHKNGDGTVLSVKETIYTYALNEARLTFTASEIINIAYISIYGHNLINLFSDYPIGQESILYGWEQIIKRICISKVAYTRRKGIKEGKACTCRSTIRPMPSKVDRMLLQMLHYFNLFLSVPDDDSRKESRSGSHALSIILVAILLEIT